MIALYIIAALTVWYIAAEVLDWIISQIRR